MPGWGPLRALPGTSPPMALLDHERAGFAEKDTDDMARRAHILDQDYKLTADGRAVPMDDPDGKTLLGRKGKAIPHAAAAAYGLIGTDALREVAGDVAEVEADGVLARFKNTKAPNPQAEPEGDAGSGDDDADDKDPDGDHQEKGSDPDGDKAGEQPQNKGFLGKLRGGN